MSLKIFHIADLHLGRRFGDHPEVMDTLSQARYESLLSTVEQANDRGPMFLPLQGISSNAHP